MKIVIAPDSFKESLSAKQVCQAIENGFRAVFPEASYHHLPLADGGEGTIEVLLQGLAGEQKSSKVQDPFGKDVNAQWALLDSGKTALIEIAAASGLDLTCKEKRNPLIASSYGTGQLIKEALELGVDKILIGLGGSATNDGGAGIVQALGGKLFNKDGEPLTQGGAALAELASIDLSELHPRCHLVKLIVACDVTNPLCGAQGASAVFGPQKGATAEMVNILDKSLSQFAHIAEQSHGKNHRDSAGFGAAGGTPLGLSLLFDLHLESGIDMVLDALQADTLLENADLIITGEGQMDNQTLQGKTPFGIAKRANARDIPVIGIAGSLGGQVDELYGRFDALFGTVRSPQALPQVLKEANANLTRTARNIAATLKLGRSLAKRENEYE